MLDLTRFHAFAPMTRLRGDLDRAFQQLAGEMFGSFAGEAPFPALNLWETDEALLVEAEIPGLRMDDLELYVSGDELTLKGERKPFGADGAKTAYHRRERGTGRFARMVRLPVAVDANAVQATLKNGVLTVTLPKAQEVRPRRIQVKTS